MDLYYQQFSTKGICTFCSSVTSTLVKYSVEAKILNPFHDLSDQVFNGVIQRSAKDSGVDLDDRWHKTEQKQCKTRGI